MLASAAYQALDRRIDVHGVLLRLFINRKLSFRDVFHDVSNSDVERNPSEQEAITSLRGTGQNQNPDHCHQQSTTRIVRDSTFAFWLEAAAESVVVIFANFLHRGQPAVPWVLVGKLLSKLSRPDKALPPS